MREAAPKPIADLIDAARRLLSDVEAEHGCFAAYRKEIEDPEHPWHDRVMQMRAALAAVDSPDNRPEAGEVEAAIYVHETDGDCNVIVDRHGEAFIERDDTGGYWLSAWVYVHTNADDT